MIFRHLLVFMLMSCYITVFAQSEEQYSDQQRQYNYYQEQEYNEGDDFSRMHFIEIDFHLTTPTSALSRNLDGPYFGIGLAYLFQLSSDRPGFIGTSFDYSFIDQASLTTFDPVDGFPFDFSTSTSMGNWSAMYRHYLGVRYLGLEPFVEGKLGVSAMWTSTRVTSSEDVEFSEYDVNHFDAALGYGFTAGVHYAVADAVYITASMGYNSSLSTQYDVEDPDVEAEFSSYDYFSRKSSTVDVIRYDLGVTFAF